MINTRSINTILGLSLAALVLLSLPLAWHYSRPLIELVQPVPAQAAAQR